MIIMSIVIASVIALAIGWVAYRLLARRARLPDDTMESVADRIGVACFRVANRIAISTLGGVVLTALLNHQQKRRA